MNRFLQEELNKIKPSYNKVSDHEIYIPKQQEVKQVELQINHIYIIKLADWIVNPSDNFSLASNWNRGVTPQCQYMKSCFTQKLGKMLKFDCLEYDIKSDVDLERLYSDMWFPESGVSVVKEIFS